VQHLSPTTTRLARSIFESASWEWFRGWALWRQSTQSRRDSWLASGAGFSISYSLFPNLGWDMDPPTHDVSIRYNNDRREDQLHHLLGVLRSYLPVLGKVLAGLLRPVCFKVPRHSVKFPPKDQWKSIKEASHDTFQE